MLQTLVLAAKNFMAMPASAGEIIHTAFEHEVWITTPKDEIEVGGQANDWLREHNINLNHDYSFSWKSVPGSRDHYRFAFVLKSHADCFKNHWQAYVVSQNN